MVSQLPRKAVSTLQPLIHFHGAAEVHLGFDWKVLPGFRV